jgi:invasion protein IalB
LFVTIGVGIVAASAQAQQTRVTERQVAAGENLTPLKLPPLPRKKVPTKKFGDWIQRCNTRPGTAEKKCFLMQTVVQTKDKKQQGFIGD